MTRSTDIGAPDADLEVALAAWAAAPVPATVARVHAALLDARLLVPVMAGLAPGEEASQSDSAEFAQMSLPTILGGDGRVALPAFTSTEALARWREQARPVPVPGAEVLRAAISEGCSALLLDLAGPISFVVEGQALEDLAAGYVPVVADEEATLAARTVAGGLPLVAPAALPSPEALAAICDALTAEPLVAEAFLLAPAEGPEKPGLTVALVLDDELDSSEVVVMVRRVAAVLARGPFVTGALDIAVLTPEQRRQARLLGPPAYVLASTGLPTHLAEAGGDRYRP